MQNRVAKTAAGLLAATAVTLPALSAPAAHADQPALAAPGAPMRMMPLDPPATITNIYGDEIRVPEKAFYFWCSQGPIGTVRTLDGTEEHVMLTASHCISQLPGMPDMQPEVMVNVDGEYHAIGTRAQKNHVPDAALDLSDPVATYITEDWGIVKLDDGVSTTRVATSRDIEGGSQGDPVTLTTIKDYPALAPWQISLDNAGQPICKDGATTGRSCGTQLFRHNDGIFSWDLNYIQGDSGGVNYDPRDGSVIGVSSMVLGPLGKAQPADRIVEEAYGIPDGQVNEHFSLTDSTAQHAQFLTTNEEFGDFEQLTADLNPDYVPPAPREELNKAIANAQEDAARVAQDALRGQINPAEIQRKAGQHVGEIVKWGDLVLAEEIGALG